MLILTSNGLSSEKLISETQKYITSKKSAAIITTASVGYKEKDWNIPRITNELQSLELSVDYIDLEFEPPEILTNYDVIEINGGNPFFLLKCMKQWRRDDLFNEFVEDKIIIGISAGSIVLQNSIELVAQYSPEMNNEVGLTDFTGFSLCDYEILPHYSRFLSIYDRFEERAKEYEDRHNVSLFRLNDGQALFLTETKVYTV